MFIELTMVHNEYKKVFVNPANITVFRPKNAYTSIGFVCGSSMEVMEKPWEIQGKIKEAMRNAKKN